MFPPIARGFSQRSSTSGVLLLAFARATLIAITMMLPTSPARAFTVNARLDLATGSHPMSVVIADVNGDGNPDLVAANDGSNTVSVFLGDGLGGFGSKTDFVTGVGPMAVAIGELNGDGKPDIVVANGGANTVSVLLGNGAGGFGAKTDFATGAVPRSVAIGDLNGDGQPDLATANFASGTASVLLGNGAGGFGANTEFGPPESGDHAVSIAIGDTNGDGVPDLEVACIGTNVVWQWLGNGTGGFAVNTGIGASDPQTVAIGDLNGDGRLDVVSAGRGNNLVVVSFGGGIPDLLFHYFPTGSGPSSVAIADVDGDARPDLVVANSISNTVSVLLGNGAGGFGARLDFATDTMPWSVAVGDVNGDGRPDLVTANDKAAGTISVLLGNGAGGFAAKADFATGLNPSSVGIGDLNGNGQLDVVTANSSANTVSLLLGNGAGGFATKTDFASGTSPSAVVVGDLNSDSHPDVVVANKDSSTVSVLLGNGSGSLGAKTDFATGGIPFSVAIGDLNGDGKPDLVVGNGGLNMSVLLGNGAGGFGAKTDFPVRDNVLAIELGDVNGDHNLDLAVAGTGHVGLLLGNGAGGFGAESFWSTGALSTPMSVALGDVNGDGKPDVVAAVSDGSVWVMPGDGTGSLTFGYSVPVGANPHSVAVVDLNGDGNPDVVTANSGSNTISVLMGAGAGGFPNRTDYATGTSPVSVAIGDVNGDGGLDLVTANNSASTVSVLLGLRTRTRTTLAVIPTQAVLGAPVTLTATVSVPPPGSGAPTDSVRFFEGTTLLGTAPLNSGVAVLMPIVPRLGDRAFTAVYKGEGTLFGSISNMVLQRVVASCLPSGPVAWWAGEGDAHDSAGTHDGVLVNGASFAAGRVGQAFSLDGVNDYVEVPGGPAFNFFNAITIGAWIKPTDGNDRYVVTKGEDSFYLAVGPTVLNKPSFWLNGVSSGWLVGTTDVADNQWHHVAGTYDGSFLRIYVDGHLENSVARTGTISTGAADVLIGYRPSPTGFFPGLIDEVAMYNRALSASEILSIVSNGIPRCGLVDVGHTPPPPFAFPSPWPNPSERATNIEFQLPARATVRVEVVDVAGRRVSLLMDRGLDAGRHSIRWDGRDRAGNRVAPGVYLVRVSTGGAAATRKIVEIR